MHHIKKFTSIIQEVLIRYPHLDTKRDLGLLVDLIIEAHKMSDLITLCEVCHINLHKKSGELQEGLTANLQPSNTSKEVLKVQRLEVDERITLPRVPDTVNDLINFEDIVRTSGKPEEVKDKEL